jgi:Zn-dependent metalloprotease
MKKILLIISVFAALSVSGSRNTTVLKGQKAEITISNSEIVRLKHFTAVPNYVKFRAGKELAFEKLESWIKQFYTTDATYGIQLIKKEVGSLGMTHYRYQQTINNIPVELSAFIAHVKDGKISAVNGNLFSDFNGASTVSLSEANALNYALNAIDASTYKWQIQQEEEMLKFETNNPEASYYPKGELVWMNDGGIVEAPMRLVYKFNIYAQKPLSRRDIFIDASTGKVVWEQNKIHHTDVIGTATTIYSGTQTITCDDASGPFRLSESGRGNGIFTYSNGNTTNYSNADITNGSANWTTPDAALDAHWGAEVTYDYFLNVHGRNSIDGNGFALVSHVHHDDEYSNAFWDGSRMTYGDGVGNSTPYTALDVAGHEITHGLTSNTANLVYQDESGALNESFSDIFGISIEFINRPAVADWVLGDDLGFIIRNMEDPKSEGDPNTYFGEYWSPLGGGDYGGVHSNSGVQNFWFVLLTDGGVGTNDNGDAYTVNSLGLTIAGEVAFRNLTTYLTQSSDYYDARFYAIQSAVDLYGGCSAEVKEVTNAWYAVGVGSEYVAYAVSDFSALIDSSCVAPFTADFNNLSLNGTSFSWNFGDGATSTDVSPLHTYLNEGTYTVELTIDGGVACGVDTTEKIDYIVIDSAIPCDTYLPTSGVGTLQTECSGTLYDSGGASSSYGANEDAQITIQPNSASTLNLTFVSFDIEAGNGNCDYDYINLYDGTSTSSPLIGKYCNDNIPTSIVANSGAVTLVFHSDAGVENAGFELDWVCTLVTQAPVAEFTVSEDTTCTGAVLFNDISTNSPSSWLWNFGDGNTSNLQNPDYTYSANGTYSVELTAINSIGSHTVIKTDLIYVNYPTSPAAVGDSVCLNASASLTASGSGILNWYSAATGGSILATGGTFVTPNLTTTATYYVADVIESSLQNLGKPDDSGAGGFFNTQSHLLFDVYKPLEIVDVQVYSVTAGLRIIELRNNSGVSLATKIANLSNLGQQTVTVNFMVDPGTDYELGLSSNSPTIELFRNNGAVNYPYTLDGVGEITRSSATQNNGLDHYYFFYDWNVKESNCVSLRTPVVAIVEDCSTGLDEVDGTPAVSTFLTTSGNLEVKLHNLKGNYSVSILNALGQVVFMKNITINSAKQNETFSIDPLSKGLYYVKVYNSTDNYTTKIVK